MHRTPDTTPLIANATRGDARAAAALLDLVYDELRDVARGFMRGESPGHTLQTTALVHEAYLKLVDQRDVDWQGSTHFKAIAAQAMRRLLIDHARARRADKRGGGRQRALLDDAFHLACSGSLDAMELNDALDRMRQLDERQATVAEYRLLGGLDSDEIARFLDVSVRTVERDWEMARMWLRRELARGADQ